MNKRGGGEDGEEQRGGEGEETYEGAGREKERHCLPSSPPCSALLIPVILFDGIRFINN